ncbi:MAG: nucleotidyltransferase domain-containing protein [Nanoarchaeota archaeon]|nr:nucleotidyltransferase domain-containing protein [Nanoarchaeota archaeon]MBU4117009.1 nucleotidyltransferase domain-containing protein [Nanoarchaeota archaeon]
MEQTNREIPEMNLNNKYKTQKSPVSESPKETKKEMEKTKKELEKLKSFIIKKYSFTQAISVLPPQAIKNFIDEEEIPKETEKHIHLYMIVPEEKLKEIPKITKEIVKQIESLKQKIWIQIKTPIDVWENCLDSKFELSSAIAMSFPLYDKGILGALRVAEIHKSLVLQKFEKYVVSYVIGGSLVRGEAIKTSDVDIFVIINDTDVKRMPRLELKERLRGIIYQYVAEASALAGVKNKLEPQIYLLTEFWESVKDAHPVMFTFIRDGIPLYDRGTFMPWKALLKMGKLKPSPEAIDMFMSMGDGVIPRSKRTLLSEIFTNIFWGVTTPAQALLMLYGLPPPNAKKELVNEFKKHFLETKMIEKKYITFLEKIVQTWKDYEHEKIKEISGTEIDKLLHETEDYLKRLKELRKQIEKKSQEKTIEQVYKDVFELLKNIVGKKSQENTIQDFEKKFIKTGKFTPQHLRILKNIVIARKECKKGKLNPHKVDEARKRASILINDLIEYAQRCDLISLEKGRMKIKYNEKEKEQTAELLICDQTGFLFLQNKIKKINETIQDSNMDEVSNAVEKQKTKQTTIINHKIFELLKKELGNFEIIL